MLDVFRRGEVARDVRMLAAQGSLAPRPLEQLGMLMVLTGDQDSEVKRTAEDTLQRLPTQALPAQTDERRFPAASDRRDGGQSQGISPINAQGLFHEPA